MSNDGVGSDNGVDHGDGKTEELMELANTTPVMEIFTDIIGRNDMSRVGELLDPLRCALASDDADTNTLYWKNLQSLYGICSVYQRIRNGENVDTEFDQVMDSFTQNNADVPENATTTENDPEIGGGSNDFINAHSSTLINLMNGNDD